MLAFPSVLAIACRKTQISLKYFLTFTYMSQRNKYLFKWYVGNLWPSSCWPKTKQTIPKIKRRVITVPACKRQACLLVSLWQRDYCLGMWIVWDCQTKPLLASLHWFAQKQTTGFSSCCCWLRHASLTPAVCTVYMGSFFVRQDSTSQTCLVQSVCSSPPNPHPPVL